MNNFATRTITGAIFVILIIASIIIHPIFFSIVFLVFTILSLLEFYNIIKSESSSPQYTTGLIISIAIYCIAALMSITHSYYILFFITIPLLFIPFIIELFRNKAHPISNISTTLLGVFYIAIPLSLLNIIPIISLLDVYHKGILLGTFILIWTNDTFAYLVGVKFGKNRLFERISPKKSWEGSIGGLIFSLIGGYILSLFYFELSLAAWLGMAVIIVISGTLGDLTESMFKRSLNIKDSGTILPGHGGLLDRLDALFIATPFIFLYLIIIQFISDTHI